MEFKADQIVNEDGRMEFRELSEFIRSLDDGNQWIYRAVGKWEGRNIAIKSSFDNAWESVHGLGKSKNRGLYESWMLMDFKREAHHYLTDLPKPNDFLEWMALARHYEMPSRLLDFSYSFFVASYFALSERKKCEDGCVLAANLNWFKNKIAENLMRKWYGRSRNKFKQASFHDPKVFRKYTFNYNGRCVVPVNPMNRNIRLARQQGLFLCPAEVECSFEENLEETLKLANKRKDVIRLVKLPSAIRSETLRELGKMNIGLHTLYGDLAGWAKSRRDLVHKPIPDGRFKMELKRAITDPLF
jgi:hypothetical protein